MFPVCLCALIPQIARLDGVICLCALIPQIARLDGVICLCALILQIARLDGVIITSLCFNSSDSAAELCNNYVSVLCFLR